MLKVVGYRKSGNHFVMALLREAGVEFKQSHVCGPSDIHVVRDPRAIAVSWVCHFILRGPERDPELIRPHLDKVAEAMRTGEHHKMPWAVYVTRASEQSRLTVRYRDLCNDPRAALLPVVDIGDAGDRLKKQIAFSSEDRAWDQHKFRQGDPDGWIDVMSMAEADKYSYIFRPGMSTVGLY